MNTQSITDLTGPQQQNSNRAHLTSSPGDAFAASTPVPPAPVFDDDDDDPQAIENAKKFAREYGAAGSKTRFPVAVAFAMEFCQRGLSAPAAQSLIEGWNHNTSTGLDRAEIANAVYAAYVEPEAAAQIINETPTEIPTQVALAPSAAELARTPQAGDDRSSAAIVATTAPSSLTVAALVDTTTPELAVITLPVGTTAPECPLCAARRKAKRERTRRWRARARNATQPDVMEAADVR